MSEPFASKIPPCPGTQHTHCLLAQTQSGKFLKATCQAAAFDENNLFQYIPICTYMRIISAWLRFNLLCLGSARGHHKKLYFRC